MKKRTFKQTLKTVKKMQDFVENNCLNPTVEQRLSKLEDALTTHLEEHEKHTMNTIRIVGKGIEKAELINVEVNPNQEYCNCKVPTLEGDLYIQTHKKQCWKCGKPIEPKQEYCRCINPKGINDKGECLDCHLPNIQMKLKQECTYDCRKTTTKQQMVCYLCGKPLPTNTKEELREKILHIIYGCVHWAGSAKQTDVLAQKATDSILALLDK